jgi:thiamine pyrophosphokinase
MEKERVCYIFGAGELHGPLPRPAAGDYVIAADGGYSHLLRAGLSADLVVGDFDSLASPPLDVETVVLPREKDETDTLASANEGLARGYRLFRIYGGTGGRLDHTLANIQCLAYLAARGARGFLYDRDVVLTALTGGSGLSFPESAAGIVSVFAHSDTAEGVFERGLKYGLSDAVLTSGFPLGVSNEFTGVAAEIGVRRGTLVVVYPRGVEPVPAPAPAPVPAPEAPG